MFFDRLLWFNFCKKNQLSVVGKIRRTNSIAPYLLHMLLFCWSESEVTDDTIGCVSEILTVVDTLTESSYFWQVFPRLDNSVLLSIRRWIFISTPETEIVQKIRAYYWFWKSAEINENENIPRSPKSRLCKSFIVKVLIPGE